jgi:hypothetical protein
MFNILGAWFVICVMRITVAPDMYVVVAKKDNTVEYWAAATVREKRPLLPSKRNCRLDGPRR